MTSMLGNGFLQMSSSVPLLNLSKISSSWNSPLAAGEPVTASPPASLLPVHLAVTTTTSMNSSDTAGHHHVPPPSLSLTPSAVKDDRLKMADNASVTSNEDEFDEKSGDPNDAEGVWSPDIEQSFHEAMAIYPPCGRRKIILSDEGKMYGRNELIARYIKLRTGKCRTRKQVSSHIQVLARRKLREMQAKVKQNTSPLVSLHDQAAKEKMLHSVASMSSAQIASAGAAGIQHRSPLSGFSLHHHSPHSAAAAPPTSYSAAAVAAAAAGGMSGLWQSAAGLHGVVQDVKPFSQHHPYSMAAPKLSSSGGVTASDMSLLSQPPPSAVWEGRCIATPRLRLVEYTAFVEAPPPPPHSRSDQDSAQHELYKQHLFVQIDGAASYEPLETISITQIYDKFPDKKGGLRELYDKGPPNSFFLVKFWADLNTSVQDGSGAFYGVTSQYESPDNMSITCSTKVCSFGKQVVEKVETEYARFENGTFVYRINRSPMCEYMVNFIHKLKHLPEKYMMNSVLENFTILQVVSNRDTQETLLCIAFVFEVSTSEHGAQHHIYRLVKD